tara:strand:+ start:7253 stop:8023 length:771 start_codon:yes stop_codon:yes gene_type:complete
MFIPLNYLISKYKLELTGVSHFGAHLGQEVKSYIDSGVKNIHLFEPQLKIFNELYKLKEKYPFIDFYNFGLGFDNSIKTINIESNNEGQSSSILNPKLHLDFYPDITFESEEEIEIKKYEELNIQNVNFLNIDIQGYELEALKGCGDSLNNIDYIYIEINRDYLYENNPLVEDIDLFLSKYRFLRVESKWASSKLPFGDAFYIKRKRLTVKTIFISQIKINLQKINFYYIFIDPYRKLNKIIYLFKKKLALLINKN